MEKQTEGMRTFIETQHGAYPTFKDYMRSLLSTFMIEEHLRIYLTEEMEIIDVANRNGQKEKFPYFGPFDILKAAFTQKYLRSVNSENLETLGDAVLETGFNLFVFKNFPNVTDPKLLSDMTQLYLSNAQFAIYAEKLGFLNWIQYDENLGLTLKDRGDVFESFVGALTMIGEYFIGHHIGNMIANEFIYRFYAFQEFRVEDRNFYYAAKSLHNDWQQALKKRVQLTYNKEFQLPDTGEWIVVVRYRGQAIRDILGDIDVITSEGMGATKEEANENAYAGLNRELSITRELIDQLRSDEFDPEIAQQEKLLKKKYPNASLQRLMGRRNMRVAYIKLPVEKRIGSKVIEVYEVRFRGYGNNALEAVKEAVKNALNDIEYQPLPYQEDIIDAEIPMVKPMFGVKKLGGAHSGEPSTYNVQRGNKLPSSVGIGAGRGSSSSSGGLGGRPTSSAVGRQMGSGRGGSTGTSGTSSSGASRGRGYSRK